MTNRERITLYVSTEAKEQFEKAVSEFYGQTDGFKSQAGELALREWADKGRDARIEEKLDQLLEFHEGGGSDESLERERRASNGSDSTSISPTNPTEKSIQAIVADLPNNTVLNESLVETPIENHAGSSYKTLKKYKRLLAKRNHIFPIPDSSGEFATSASTLAMQCEIRDRISPADTREIVRSYADSLGADLEHPEEWYLEELDEKYVEHNSLKFDRVPDLDSSEWREETFGEGSNEFGVQ